MLLAVGACAGGESARPTPRPPSASSSAPVASASASVSSDPDDPCSPPVKDTLLARRGCRKVCVGRPAAAAEACIADDMNELIPPFWLPRVLTLSLDGTTVFRAPIAFGPLDAAGPDPLLVRLRVVLSADHEHLDVTDDPTRSCAAAKKTVHAGDPPFQSAVDRICAVRGAYVFEKGRFVRAP